MNFKAILIVRVNPNHFYIGNGPTWKPLAQKECEIFFSRDHLIALFKRNRVSFKIDDRLFSLGRFDQAKQSLLLYTHLTDKEMTRAFMDTLCTKGFTLNEEGMGYLDIN